MKKKSLTMFLISAMLLAGTANCFGKFSLTRKIYTFNDSINAGGGLVGKLVKTLVMYAMFIIPVYGIGGAVDLIILNLIEFWTDSNPLGLNEFDKNGNYVKEMAEGNLKIQMIYSGFGEKMTMNIHDGKNSASYVSVRNQPGILFEEKNGVLVPVSIESEKIGNKAILKMVKDGKLESAKVVDYSKISEMESKLSVY